MATNGLSQVSEADFEREVLMSEQPVLVEFGAEWCGPCKTVAPELKALAQELQGKAKVVTVDIDRSPMLARQLGVQSVPTFHIADPACLESAELIRHRPAGGKDEVQTTGWLPAGPLAVGLTSGASTPDNLVGAAIERLASFCR